MNPNHHNILKVKNWLHLIPNIILLIFMIKEKPQASNKEIIACEIPHHPS